MSVLQKLNALPAIRIARRLVGRESVYVVRERLACEYLRGSGIEFGALNFALTVPKDVRVRYADLQDAEDLRRQFPDLKKITAPDIVTDLESMKGIDDSSVDFVIANHVLEHVENPLRTLRSISRVLRYGGIAFIALPDKRFSFDKSRTITPIDHLVRDYEEGPDWSLAQHYDDWARNVGGLRGPAFERNVSEMLARRVNIHFHVWDYAAMIEMFKYATSLPEIPLSIQHSQPNRSEAIWILRKESPVKDLRAADESNASEEAH